MTYGYCVYHELECDYSGPCRDCTHNTEEDTEWFIQDDEKAEIDFIQPKKMVGKLISVDVLDEIRAEIIDKYMSADGKMGKVSADILKIIDKRTRGKENDG